MSALSGGWQRRVNIAAALHQPSILVLDEPTAALDVEARHNLWGLIEDLNRKGMTILLTTHHLEEAERLCTRVGIIRNGRLQAEGLLDELVGLINAVQLAVIETADESAVVGKADAMGWSHRCYGGRTVVWLPRIHTFKQFVDAFSDVPLVSVSLRPVGLEDVYIEVLKRPMN